MEALADILEILSTFGYVFILIAIPVSIYEGFAKRDRMDEAWETVSHERQTSKAGKVQYQIKTMNADRYAREAYKVRANRRASN